MEVTLDIKRAICSLFEVHPDEGGVQRIVTPLEYVGSGDKVVVRVRPEGAGYRIDESGESAMFAALSGGDVESDTVTRWAEDLAEATPVRFLAKDEVLYAETQDQRLIPPYVFRVAEAAQQLHAIATSRTDRRVSDFKARVAEIVAEVVRQFHVPHQADVELPIVGGLRADHVIGDTSPMILIAANSPARLLEAEVIYMQYRAERKPGMVVAIAESQAAVGRKQFERAGYYTSRSLIFNPDALLHFVQGEIAQQH